MALQVWLPLNGNLENQGLSNLKFSLVSGNISINSSGKIGSCYSKTEHSGNGGIVSDATIDLGQSVSMFCWVKFDDFEYADSNLIGLFGQHRHNAKRGLGLTVYCASTTTGIIALTIGDGTNRSWNTYRGTTVLASNVWYHVGFTYNNSNVTFYVNGNVDGTATCTNLNVSDYIQLFGWSFSSSNTTQAMYTSKYMLKGSLNDVRIYDNCLSRQEVKEVAQSLILHYKLDSIQNNILPPGIELYDTLQADGSSWINTKIPYDSTKTTYVVKCKFSQPSNTGQYDAVFGAYTGESYKCFRIIRGNNNSIMWSYYNSQAGGGSGNRIQFSTANTNVREVVMTVNGVTLTENGTTTSYNYGTRTGTDTTSTFYLFSQNGTGSCRSRTVLYYWTIWDGDVMLGNFLPATFYGEPGMWDTVTKKFFHNEGTGTFILGNKITIKEYEYLQCDTSSYIKSGVFPTTSTNFEMKYEANAVSSQNVFFGCSTVLAYNSGNNFSMDILANGSLLYTFKNQGYYTAPYTVTANTPFITKLSGSTFTVNGISMPANRHTSHPNLEIYLFGHNVNGAINPSYPPRVGKIYYCKFWEGDDLIRDFIPVSYNGTLGLFDKVELKFYPNAGSGTFTAGTLVSEIVEDCSGYGHDGTVINEVLTIDGSPKYNKYAQFSTTSYIKCTSPTAEVRSASFWLKIPALPPSSQSYYQIAFVDQKSKLCLAIGKSSAYFSTSCGGSSYASAKYSAANLTLNEWHHIVVVNTGTSYTSMTRNVYIDGVLQTPLTTTDYWNYDVDELQIGRRSTANNYTTNEISDLRLYATALSDDDVMQLYKTSASIDNLAGFHTFEIEEKNHTPSIQKNGETLANNFIEIGDRIMIHTDGSVWLQVLHHNNPSEQIFSAANCWNYDNGASLYSALWLLKNDEWKYNGKYELLAKEQLTSGAAVTTYRWTQTSNPALTTSITGFTALEGVGAAQFKGLLSNGSYGAMHNGTTWYSCFGAYNRYQGGCPGFTTTVITTGCLDLYIRIPEITVKGATSSKAAIYQTAINATKFLEV